MQHVVLIDHGSGNLRSAQKALLRAAETIQLACQVTVSAHPDDVAAATRIVLPGVGAFGDGMAGLGRIDGLLGALQRAVHERRTPFLGICLGMQLLASRGHEFGVHRGLDWLPGEVTRLTAPGLKIPHMGWNQLAFTRAHPLLEGLEQGAEAYFVHSYALTPSDAQDVLARTDYGGPVTAMVARDNIAGTQFHPEKSQRVGLHLLANFLAWEP